MTSASRRGAVLAYAACIAAFAGLMSIVAFGGGAISARPPAADLTASQVSALKPAP